MASSKLFAFAALQGVKSQMVGHMKCALVALVVLGTPVSAEPKTSWHEQCTQETFACYAYIQGIYETTRALAGKNGTKSICAPDDFNAPDMAKYMVKFLNEPGNEDLKSVSFSGLVIAALESSYPCK